MKLYRTKPAFTIWFPSCIGWMLAGCFFTWTLSAQENLTETSIRKIDSLCMAYLQQHHYPGLAIGIGQKGKGKWTKGYGYASLKDSIPVDPEDHLFRIGSVSKSVTAAALMRLVARNEIDLDLPIGSYWKECPADKSGITLRQLTGHLTGIRHYNGLEFFSQLPYRDVMEPLEVFIHDTLLFTPGQRFEYTTYGWTLISAIMQKATGKDFLTILRDEISIPCQITDLKADHSDSTHFSRVGFYAWQNETHHPGPVVNNSNKWAGGGLLCSAEDLVRFGQCVLTDAFLAADIRHEMMTSMKTSSGDETGYGIGIGTGKDGEGRWWCGHSGGSVGGTSMWLIYPHHDLVIVTLVNQSSASMQELAWRIGDIILSE